MKDQVRAMAERSVRAVYVGDAKEDVEVAKICTDSYQLVFLSLEELLRRDLAGHAPGDSVQGES